MSMPSATDVLGKQARVVGGGAPEAVNSVLYPKSPYDLPNPYADESNINKMYDVLRALLNRQGGTAMQGAQQTAAAQAGSRGLVNPSGFIGQQGSNAYAPFIQALLQAEGSRAGALQQNLGNRTAFDMWKAQANQQFAQQSSQERNQLNQQLNPWNQIQPLMQIASMFAGIPGIGKFLGIGGGGTPTMQGGDGGMFGSSGNKTTMQPNGGFTSTGEWNPTYQNPYAGFQTRTAR